MFNKAKLKKSNKMTTKPSALDAMKLNFEDMPNTKHKIVIHRGRSITKVLSPLMDYARYVIGVVIS